MPPVVGRVMACEPSYLLQAPQAGGREAMSVEGWAPSDARLDGRVAIVPIVGEVNHREGHWWYPGVVLERLNLTLDKVESLVDAGLIQAVLFDVESPGGYTNGLADCADRIFALKKKVKTVALIRDYAYSGGYWLASAASEVVMTQSGSVGSIGCWKLHIDETAAYEMMGLKITDFSKGRYKTATAPWKELGPEGTEVLERDIDACYTQFCEKVATYRGVPVEKIVGTESKTFGVAEALKLSLADRVSTFRELLGELQAKAAKGGFVGEGMSAAEEMALDAELSLTQISQTSQAPESGMVGQVSEAFQALQTQVTVLETEKADLLAKLSTLEGVAEKQAAELGTLLVDLGIASGRILPKDREQLLQQVKSAEGLNDVRKKALEGPSRISQGRIKPVGATLTVKDFKTMSESEKKALYEENPEEYKRLSAEARSSRK